MKVRNYLILMILLFAMASAAHAEVDARVLRTLQLNATPVDLAIPGNGRYIYVLTSDAKLKVFLENGELRDTLTVDPGVDSIQPGPREDRLYLVNSTSQQIQVLFLDFVHKIPVGRSPIKGPVDAAVTVAVFTDFQCPYCARIVPVLDQLLEKYPREVRLVFKNYPLRSHTFARKAAAAALAAHHQDRFWDFHDALFENYSKLDEVKVKEIRDRLNLDKKRFDTQRKTKAVMEQIQGDIRVARDAGVNSTPSVFINGRRQNKRSLKDLSAFVDAELQRLAR